MNCKIPKLYRAASSISQSVKEEKRGINQLIYDKKYDHFNRKGLLAIVSKVIENFDALNNIIKESEILEKEPYLKPWLLRVFLSELLSGRKIPDNNKTCQTILKYRQSFPESLGSTTKPDTFLPRYIRVNTLKTNRESVLKALEQDGWSLIETPPTYKKYLKALKKISEKEMMVDFHLPEVLVFHPKTPFYETRLFKNSHIILQDKASCVSAYLLAPEPSSEVLDMCAAPGLKTSYLAALKNNEGVVYAVDRNAGRYRSMIRLMTSYGASCVVPLNMDSCNVSSGDFDNVEYIMLDPPCSGSGIAKRIGDIYKSEERFKKLSNLQSKLLRCALTKFPTVKRVVYSTCSIHPEENEAVIEGALKMSYTDRFELVNVHEKLKEGVSPGSDDYECGKHCAYWYPNKDFTNGFFIAVFERVSPADVPLEKEVTGTTNVKGKKRVRQASETVTEGDHKKKGKKHKTPATQEVNTMNKNIAKKEKSKKQNRESTAKLNVEEPKTILEETQDTQNSAKAKSFMKKNKEKVKTKGVKSFQWKNSGSVNKKKNVSPPNHSKWMGKDKKKNFKQLKGVLNNNQLVTTVKVKGSKLVKSDD